MLLSLTERLSAADGITLCGETVVIPEDVVERVEARHKNRLAYFIADLRDASTALVSDVSLTEETLETLDEICDAAGRFGFDLVSSSAEAIDGIASAHLGGSMQC